MKGCTGKLAATMLSAAMLTGGCDNRLPGDIETRAAPTASSSPPLLGSKRAQHVWASYCEGQPDDAPLPQDPRSRIQRGANADRAVFFNAYWQDCHVNQPDEQKHAKTCGEYRARRDRGFHFLMDELPTGAMTAEEFNNTWQKWGLPGRPENFE